MDARCVLKQLPNMLMLFASPSSYPSSIFLTLCAHFNCTTDGNKRYFYLFSVSTKNTCNSSRGDDFLQMKSFSTNFSLLLFTDIRWIFFLFFIRSNSTVLKNSLIILINSLFLSIFVSFRFCVTKWYNSSYSTGSYLSLRYIGSNK